MTSLRIVHLYPTELGIYGDVGNVIALQRRAAWRGIPAEIIDHHPGDELVTEADIVHIGNGSTAGQEVARADLARIKDRLLEWKATGVPFLAIGAGWQLLGRDMTRSSGETVDGVGIFGSSSHASEMRFVGELVLETELGMVAGFENHGADTTLHDNARPLGTVRRRESSASAVTEGIRDGSSIGTNLHGSFLPMNPGWADRLLADAIGPADWKTVENAGSERIAAVDAAAAESRSAIARRLGAN